MSELVATARSTARMSHAAFHVCTWLSLVACPAHAQVPTSAPAWLPSGYAYDAPWFLTTDEDPAVPTPAALLGFEPGARPATHAEIERCLKTWDASDRTTLHEYGRTHEGRALYYAVITSPENHARLDAIREAVGKLADPRRIADENEAQQLVAQTPAVAWLSYGIHGDETSGCDAALVAVHRLVAGRDAETLALLGELVILVDPVQNPDGRERFIRQTGELAGVTPTLDVDSLTHSGRWPEGRTNHYLFDLNRDWTYGTQPETRGKWAAVAAWNPQLFVDSHEMWPDSTFMSNPAREPFNPNLSPLINKWWKTFADDSGKAFDVRGWSYYTREWADFWYPGYSDAWACFHGAVGMLYEQAGVGGRPILHPSGTVLTYREAVHHQLVATFANLNTLRQCRAAILADFLAQKRAALADPSPGEGRTFLLPPGPNASRIHRFLAALVQQGIEVSVAKEPFAAEKLVDTLRNSTDRRDFPAGTYIVQRRQPRGALVGALLDFDPRMTAEFLNAERRDLETRGRSRMYDISAWSLPIVFDLDAYWSATDVAVVSEPYVPPPPPAGAVDGAPAPYAYLLDMTDDDAPRALAHVLLDGVAARVAQEPFRAAGRSFERGTILIRRHENGPELVTKLERAARAAGVHFAAVPSARSPDDGPDLGGGEFARLVRPRVAMLAGDGVDDNALGETWFALDCEVGLPVSLISERRPWSADLRRYNVLILPPASGESLGRWLDAIKGWVADGGTLVAFGGSAEWLAGEERGLTSVRRREDVIDRLDEYADATALEQLAGRTAVDAAALWDTPAELLPMREPASAPATFLDGRELDDFRRTFSPVGSALRGVLKREHWLTFGSANPARPEGLALFTEGGMVLLSKSPAQTPVRFASADRLRVSGLLWPEAAARLADSAYATVERHGHGQVVLFAQRPNFRGAWHGTKRLFLNAVLLGPGCGASLPAP
ncbi:MAG: hypothetical protein HRF50_05085 [Phycisphaerae bacterium]|jgi:hypothetical protein